MASTVKIILDNYDNNVCYSGQTLSGKVECCFNNEKKIRALRIEFKGRAKTKWISGSGKTSTVYRAEENYFCEEYNLVSGADDLHLQAGIHTYPFSYTLPHSLPSSFEGRCGKICHTIKTTVDRRWKADYEATLVLNVVSPLDLNRLPELREPLAISVDKEVRSGCCRTDPLTFNIFLPFNGFVEGQQMNIGAFVQNMSNVNVAWVQFRIMQATEFIGKSLLLTKKKHEKVLLMEYKADGSIGAHAEKAWTSSFTIPTNSFKNLRSCSIINTTYHVEATVVLPALHSNLSTTFPIIIGSVPLAGVNMELLGPPPEMSYYASNFNATAPPFEDVDRCTRL